MYSVACEMQVIDGVARKGPLMRIDRRVQHETGASLLLKTAVLDDDHVDECSAAVIERYQRRTDGSSFGGLPGWWTSTDAWWVLVLDDSLAAFDAMGRGLARRLPRSEPTGIPGAGHAPCTDEPEAYAHAVRTWVLARHLRV